MESNELNKNALGGTELLAKRLRFRLSDDLMDQWQFHYSRVREVDASKKQLFYAHDMHNDPEAIKALGGEGWKRFDRIICVSHWQKTLYCYGLGIPENKIHVIRNSIVPIEEHTKPTDKLRLIYFSTPHRGLGVLYDAFNHLTNIGNYSHLELNVFSSFGLYGWKERDKPYEHLFEALDKHPQINYSGAVSNDRIREELKRSHIFAYPSTWPETSCLCLIEAMSAGLMCVHSSLGALPETSMGLTTMYEYTDNNMSHLNRFYGTLQAAIDAYPTMGEKLHITKHLADGIYNVDLSTEYWKSVLT